MILVAAPRYCYKTCDKSIFLWTSFFPVTNLVDSKISGSVSGENADGSEPPSKFLAWRIIRVLASSLVGVRKAVAHRCSIKKVFLKIS